MASWYGPGFEGRRTANGETFDPGALTAAHPNLPFGSRIRVENLANARTVEVRINDRGPSAGGRIIDLSRRAAEVLDMIEAGVVRVRIYILERGGSPLPRLMQPGSSAGHPNLSRSQWKPLQEPESDPGGAGSTMISRRPSGILRSSAHPV
jgi:rare lipoprotein A